MNLTLNINSQDYGFVVEAIKLRTLASLDSLAMDKQAAEQAAQEDEFKAKQEIHKMASDLFDQEIAKVKARPAFKKKVAARNAPFGLKKDGTPKAKPGRK